MSGVPVEAFIALMFDGNYPNGTLDLHPAFFANRCRGAARAGLGAAVVIIKRNCSPKRLYHNGNQ